MDLSRAMAEAQLAITYFFNNKFAEARAIMQPWYDLILTKCYLFLVENNILYKINNFFL